MIFPSIWRRETGNEVKQFGGDGRKKFFFSLPYSICFCLLSPKLSGEVACIGMFANTLITGSRGRKRDRMIEREEKPGL